MKLKIGDFAVYKPTPAWIPTMEPEWKERIGKKVKITHLNKDGSLLIKGIFEGEKKEWVFSKNNLSFCRRGHHLTNIFKP